MRLYHFTQPKHLKAIMRDGLKASAAHEGNAVPVGGKPVVWLTDRPTLAPSQSIKKELLRRGTLARGSNLPHATVCLSVRIPDGDRKLARYLDWLNRSANKSLRSGLDIEFVSRTFGDTWAYFGDIAPENLAVFKRVARGKVFWHFPHIEAAHARGERITVGRKALARLFSPDITQREAERLLRDVAPPPKVIYLDCDELDAA
jgi:hypothetical protein